MNRLLHPLRAYRLHRLDVIREQLPLTDPDRHALDTVADARFARLAPGYPDTSNPADFAASVTAKFVEPPEWGPAPVYPPRSAVPESVTDVQTGGVL